MPEMDRNIDINVLFGSFAARYKRWCLTQVKEGLIQAISSALKLYLHVSYYRFGT